MLTIIRRYVGCFELQLKLHLKIVFTQRSNTSETKLRLKVQSSNPSRYNKNYEVFQAILISKDHYVCIYLTTWAIAAHVPLSVV